VRLSAAEIAARWETATQENTSTPALAVEQPSAYRMYEPLADAADSFVRWAQATHERIHLGVPMIDEEMRGVAPGEMAMMIGFAHGGKTLALLHMLRHNHDKHVALFIPDEPRQLVLTKLTCIHHGIPARELEARVASDDKEAIGLMRSTAQDHFKNLAVFDQPLSANDMERAYHELCDVWGQAPELVVVDYLDLVEAGETVPDKATFLKSFGRRHDVPLLVLHQTSRTAGADGAKLTMSSGSYGGEQQATSIIGVRRKKFQLMAEINETVEKLDRAHSERAQERLDELRYLLTIHEFTVTMSLLKNKRPGGQLVDDIDYEIDLHTGRLRQLRPQELPQQHLEKSHASF
jgi:replicative DNA helicase